MSAIAARRGERTERFSPERIASARERHRLSALIGRDVKLVKRGGEFLGLCPFHGERTPSFTVSDLKGFFHCFGCGAHGDAIGWRMQIAGLSFADAVAELDGGAMPDRRELERREVQREDEDRRRRENHREMALRLWHEARPIGGTAGEAYFRARGVTITLPPSLRFHPRCIHGPRDARQFLPAVIAGVQSPDGPVTAIHRIYLGRDSARTGKALDKQLLGAPCGGAIRLGAAGPSLGLAEGIETGLAVLQACRDRPVWVAIAASFLPGVVLPAIVTEPVLLADRDPVCWTRGPLYGLRPGEHFARVAAARFREQGRRPRIAAPIGIKADFDDVLRR